MDTFAHLLLLLMTAAVVVTRPDLVVVLGGRLRWGAGERGRGRGCVVP